MKHIFKLGVPFFLSYVKTQTWANTRLELRVGALKAHPYLVVGGRRARKILILIETTLKAHRIHFDHTKQDDRDILKIPYQAGVMTTIFLFTIYSTRLQSRYTTFYNNLLLREAIILPFLIEILELAKPLTDQLRIEASEIGPHHEHVEHEAARIISKMIRVLVEETDADELLWR